MSRTCFIHAGTGKTGSSALQYALARTRPDLKRQGYNFPSFGINFERMEKGYPTGGNASGIWKALRNEDVDGAVSMVAPFADSNEHLILSNEGLYSAPPDTMAAFASGLRALGYQPKCLIFFRPQVEQIVSAFLQRARSKGIHPHRTLAEFAVSTARNEKNWYAVAQKIERAFGYDNLTVKWYPAAMRTGGVVHAAFEWLGLPTPQLPIPNVNPTPGREAFEVIQAVIGEGLVRTGAGSGARKFFDKFLARAREERLLGSKIALETAEAMVVHESTRAANQMLVKRYCPQLSADEEIKAPPSHTQPPIDETMLGRLRVIAAEMLIEGGAEKERVERALGSSPAIRELASQ